MFIRTVRFKEHISVHVGFQVPNEGHHSDNIFNIQSGVCKCG